MSLLTQVGMSHRLARLRNFDEAGIALGVIWWLGFNKAAGKVDDVDDLPKKYRERIKLLLAGKKKPPADFISPPL